MKSTAMALLQMKGLNDTQLDRLAFNLAMDTIKAHDGTDDMRYVFSDLSALAWSDERCEFYLCQPECWCEVKEHKCK